MLAARSEDLSMLSQQQTLLDLGGPFKGDKGVYTAAWDRSVNMDGTLRYVTYCMFNRLHSLSLNYNLYSEFDKGSQTL